MAGERDLYGTEGSVPENVAVDGTGAHETSARATPAAFGSGVGGTLQEVGQRGEELVQKYQQINTESKVNDDYANKYVPAAIALRNQYDTLDSKDKEAGYQQYIGSLQELNKQFSASQPNVIGQKMMSSQINRHIEGEVEGANRELVQSQLKYQAKSSLDMMDANTKLASKYYNDHDFAQNLSDQNKGIITLQHINAEDLHGVPYNQDTVDDQHRLQEGTMAVARVSSALQYGDIGTAHDIVRNNSSSLSAAQQLNLGTVLHQQDMSTFGKNGISYLTSGRALPDSHGYPPYQVQAIVADAAQAGGIDPNHALAVAKIESNYGQNLGTRGDIGQTGKSGNIQEQAQNMVVELKKSEAVATNALGRKAEPWEQYTCYQQGASGGPALLKAANDNPNARAIDVLKPLYKNPSDARSAILNNGGTETMTAGDYLNFIKQKYQDNAAQALCTTQDPQGIGNAIRNSHENTIPAVQPTMTPKQALIDFDKRSGHIMDAILAHPVGVQRDALMEAFTSLRSRYEGASNRYTQALVDHAQQLMADPKFTMDQLSPEETAELSVNHPQTLNEMRNRSEAIQKYGFEQAAKITDKNSPNFYDNLQRSMTPFAEGNSITNENELHTLLGRKDAQGINLKDYKDLKTAINLPEEWKKELKKQTSDIANANGNLDGQGQERAQKYFLRVLSDKDKAKPEDIAKMLDPTDSSYIGNMANGYKMSIDAQVMNNAEKIRNSSSAVQTFSSKNDKGYLDLPVGSVFINAATGKKMIKR